MNMRCKMTLAAALTAMVLCGGAAIAGPPALIAAPPPRAEDAKALVNRRLDRFIAETDAMLDARISKVREFFDERKGGGMPFAKKVLGLDAKLQMSGDIGGAILAGIGELFGAAPSKPTDSFTPYVRRCFRENVLDPAKVREALGEAATGYRGDIAEAEGRLLVALRADLPQAALEVGGAPPDLAAEVRAVALCDALITETVDAAVNDLGVSLCSFVVSNIIGDKIADGITPKDTSKAGRFAVNLATGAAVDAAIDQSMRAAGYDPERDIAARIGRGIGRIEAAIIGGDPEVLKLYPHLSDFRRCHPDQAVRDACRRADEAVERSLNVGLLQRLNRLRNERYRGLWTTLMSHLGGVGAASSPLLMYEPLDAENCPPPGELIRWAGEITRWAAAR